MDLSNQRHIAAPPEAVWTAILDAEILRRCIPGCESIERLEDGAMSAVVVLKVGPVKARFSGKVHFEDVVAPKSLVLAGEGSGGIAGHARGSAAVSLEPQGDGTLLSYTADAQVGGKIAQIGSRLVQSTAQKLAGEFFDRFEKEMAGGVMA